MMMMVVVIPVPVVAPMIGVPMLTIPILVIPTPLALPILSAHKTLPIQTLTIPIADSIAADKSVAAANEPITTGI